MHTVRSPFAGAKLRHGLTFPSAYVLIPRSRWGDGVRAVVTTEESETGIFTDPEGIVVRSNCNRCGAIRERLHRDISLEFTELTKLIEGDHATWTDAHRAECLPALREIQLWAALYPELEFLLRNGIAGLKAGELRGMIAARGERGVWTVATLDDVFCAPDAANQVRMMAGRNAALRKTLRRQGNPPVVAIGLAIFRGSERTDPAQSDTLVIQAATSEVTLEMEFSVSDIMDLEDGQIPVPTWRPVDEGLLAGVLAQRVPRAA